MTTPSLLQKLTDALRCMPGVGPKSAQRIAYHLLARDRAGASRLGEILQEAVEKIGHCSVCRTFTEHEVCELCASPRRDDSQLCVVEGPQDILAIEQATDYRGRYFVLLGRLSPLDGIGPENLGLDQLTRRLDEHVVKELIVAVSTTMEGEATAHYLRGIAHDAGIRITRIAYGVPIGGELEFVDRGTLSHAIASRREL
ncbi:MAG: recombination protein RecR [Gammaproteobacteria bacterium]|nr:recombination protein RecR [Gammaproteobacteria bacterium]